MILAVVHAFSIHFYGVDETSQIHLTPESLNLYSQLSNVFLSEQVAGKAIQPATGSAPTGFADTQFPNNDPLV